MTPEQLKQKPFKEIFKKQHENLDTEQPESSKYKEKNESTTSSDMSELDYQSDTTVDDIDVSNTTQTLQVIIV